MNDTIDRYVKKAHRTYYDDGLAEMISGLFMAGSGAALVLVLAFDLPPFTDALLFLVILAAVIALGLLLRRFVLGLKDRITYSRSGYVSYRHDEPDYGRWILLLVGVVLIAALLFLPEQFNTLQFAIGALLAAVLLYLGYRLTLARFYAVGSACFLVGLASTIWIDDEYVGAAVTLLGCGLLLLLSGTIALANFLRHNPDPGREPS